MRRALITCRATETNDALARAGGREAAWEVLTPASALVELRAGDAALGRLDVLPTHGEGGWTVLEVNGDVEFSGEYASWGDVFAETAKALAAEADQRLACREAAPAAAAV